MSALVWLAVGALALYAVAFSNLVLRVRGMTLRRPSERIASADEVPPWLLAFAEPAIVRLTALGFERVGALASVALDRQADAETIDLVFFEPTTGTCAFVYLPPTVPGARPLCVDFATWGADGTLRLTLALAPGPTHRDAPGTTVVAYPELSLGRRFARHAFETAALVPRAPGLAEIASDLTHRHGAALAGALAAGDVAARADGTFRHTIRGTIRLLARLVAGMVRSPAGTGAFHGAYGPDRVGEASPPEQQALVHEELLCLAAGRRRPGRALLVFAASLALFVLSVADHFEGLVLPVLVCVLLLHELGHFAAMRFFGYRDTSVFFLPFLGAAAAGSKPEASVSERAVVLLAGPVPGLALGLWAWHAPPDVPGHAALTSTSALLLIVVNLFNLLPVSPLDGGRLVERVLLAPWPTGAWVFKAASAGAFVLVGLLTEEGLVTAIGLVVAASLPAGIRAARVARRRATVGPPPDRAGLYALVDAAGYSGLRFGRKLALVQTLEQQFATPPATPLVRRLWLLVYVGVLGAGLHGARGLFG